MTDLRNDLASYLDPEELAAYTKMMKDQLASTLKSGRRISEIAKEDSYEWTMLCQCLADLGAEIIAMCESD